MNATETRLAELKCPVCGSDDIVEWNDVPTRFEIERVEIDEKGDLIVDYTGESEAIYDGCSISGYSCRSYCVEGPLETFVVNK